MSKATELESPANSFVSESREQWANLVRVAFRTSAKDTASTATALSEAAGVGKSNLLRKIQAIHAARTESFTVEQLISMGQARTMSKFVKEQKAKRTEDFVFLKLGMSSALKQALLENFWKIGKALGIKTQEQVLEYVNSILTDMTVDDIRHYAGEGNAQKQSQSPR